MYGLDVRFLKTRDFGGGIHRHHLTLVGYSSSSFQIKCATLAIEPQK